LIAAFFGAKDLGLIGRLFSDGTNVQQSFELSKPGDTFTLALNPTRRGTYRYQARLRFDDKNTTEGEESQSGRFTITETLCRADKILEMSDIELRAGSKTFTYSALGRYGKEIRLPLGKKRSSVCLKIAVEELSQPVVSNAAIHVYALNTRPCWFIECLLD
jgi:hypothetical protein